MYYKAILKSNTKINIDEIQYLPILKEDFLWAKHMEISH